MHQQLYIIMYARLFFYVFLSVLEFCFTRLIKIRYKGRFIWRPQTETVDYELEQLFVSFAEEFSGLFLEVQA